MRLNTSVSKLPLVGPVYVKRLQKLGIENIEDLLHHIPHRYVDYRATSKVAKVQPGEKVTVQGFIKSMKNIYTKGRKKLQIAEIEDNTGNMQVVWFNQPFLAKSIKKGSKYSFSGKVDWFSNKKSFISPEYENMDYKDKGVHTGRLVPIYPTTSGISTKWLRGRINYAYTRVEDKLMEFLPDKVLKGNNLNTYHDSIKKVHFPEVLEDVEPAKERLAFNEFLMHQLKSLYKKSQWEEYKAVHNLDVEKNLYNKFANSLPFKLTASQKRSIKEILEDLKRNIPMNRLLEGDVGSGKTVVAAAAAFAAFSKGYQTIFMAPTQILAQQHYKTLKGIFKKFKVRTSLVTSAGIKSDIGKVDIFVGTHALIHKKIQFDNVALVVIDEQHRFGVEQRAHLVKKTGNKTEAPHVLTMTATPIPRTVALTVYGELDLSTLTELPKGRQPITTWIVPPQKRDGAYDWIKMQVKEKGIQVFVICPLIEESDKESMQQVKAATAEYEKLKKVFKNLTVDILHGKQKAKEKNRIITKFKKDETDILVSTPVVEVGIDVPNAAIMIIEGADRFGLAQLHQLRGRIGRGKEKSYCLLFTQNRSPKVMNRLKALKQNKSGFELAEIDLQLRGPGEIFGTKQHGYPELKIASWHDSDLIKKARKVAQEAVEKPETYSMLIKKLEIEKVVMN